MPFQPIPNVASVEIRYDMPDAVRAENRIFFLQPAGYTLATVQALSQIVDNWVGTSWRGNLPSAVNYRETFVRGQTMEEDVQAVSADGAGPGLLNNPPLPNEVSFAVKFETGLTGRSARGRLYVTGLIENDVTGNLLSVTRANEFVNSINTLFATAQASNWIPVVVQRINDGELLPAGIPRPIVDVGFTDLIVDSQRGRKPSLT